MQQLHGLPGISKGMRVVLDNVDVEGKISLLNKVYDRSKQFRQGLKEDGIEAMPPIYELIDGEIAKSKRRHNCKKGCSYCCHINVEISEPEAHFIVKHCADHKIHIDTDYLKNRLAVPEMEVGRSNYAACAFLKDGICSIYEARPLTCRSYFVQTDPKLCDVSVKSKQVKIVVNPSVELEFSAFMEAVNGDLERMEAKLLKVLTKL